MNNIHSEICMKKIKKATLVFFLCLSTISCGMDDQPSPKALEKKSKRSCFPCFIDKDGFHYSVNCAKCTIASAACTIFSFTGCLCYGAGPFLWQMLHNSDFPASEIKPTAQNIKNANTEDLYDNVFSLWNSFGGVTERLCIKEE